MKYGCFVYSAAGQIVMCIYMNRTVISSMRVSSSIVIGLLCVSISGESKERSDL